MRSTGESAAAAPNRRASRGRRRIDRDERMAVKRNKVNFFVRRVLRATMYFIVSHVQWRMRFNAFSFSIIPFRRGRCAGLRDKSIG